MRRSKPGGPKPRNVRAKRAVAGRAGQHSTGGRPQIDALSRSAPAERSISAAIKSYELGGTAAWRSIQDAIPNASLFAIESRPDGIVVHDDSFSARARILVHAPQTLPSGRESYGSAAIPARIKGILSEGAVEIVDVSLALG